MFRFLSFFFGSCISILNNSNTKPEIIYYSIQWDERKRRASHTHMVSTCINTAEEGEEGGANRRNRPCLPSDWVCLHVFIYILCPMALKEKNACGKERKNCCGNEGSNDTRRRSPTILISADRQKMVYTHRNRPRKQGLHHTGYKRLTHT